MTFLYSYYYSTGNDNRSGLNEKLPQLSSIIKSKFDNELIG